MQCRCCGGALGDDGESTDQKKEAGGIQKKGLSLDLRSDMQAYSMAATWLLPSLSSLRHSHAPQTNSNTHARRGSL